MVGAVLDIEIHVPPQIAKVLTDGGQPVPAPVTGLALIDTGATITGVHHECLSRLALNPIGKMDTGTAGGVVKRDMFPARLVCPSQRWAFDLAAVLSVDLAGQLIPMVPQPQPVIALLGRNFLEKCLFIYNGPGGFWTLSTS
jgi:hypothetical protein